MFCNYMCEDLVKIGFVSGNKSAYIYYDNTVIRSKLIKRKITNICLSWLSLSQLSQHNMILQYIICHNNIVKNSKEKKNICI